MEYIVTVIVLGQTFHKSHTSLNAALQTAGTLVEGGRNPTIHTVEAKE